jgi:hypothetical protein
LVESVEGAAKQEKLLAQDWQPVLQEFLEVEVVLQQKAVGQLAIVVWAVVSQAYYYYNELTSVYYYDCNLIVKRKIPQNTKQNGAIKVIT